jgi:hypothetical protein
MNGPESVKFFAHYDEFLDAVFDDDEVSQSEKQARFVAAISADRNIIIITGVQQRHGRWMDIHLQLHCLATGVVLHSVTETKSRNFAKFDAQFFGAIHQV